MYSIFTSCFNYILATREENPIDIAFRFISRNDMIQFKFNEMTY